MASAIRALAGHVLRIMASRARATHHGICATLGPVPIFFADWSFDLLVILSVSCFLSEQPRVDWGVHRGRGVGSVQ